MTLERLDLRGLICPEPVIATKKQLDKADTEQLEALVDDDVCVANLERLARSFKAGISVEQRDGFFAVTISKKATAESEHMHHVATASPAPAMFKGSSNRMGTVIFISKEQFGEGDPEFSKTLANVFLQTMFESGHRPRAILLANSGVKLMARELATRKVLDDFASAGCEVFACGLCVEFYGLKADIGKEQITNMFAICEYLLSADKVLQF